MNKKKVYITIITLALIIAAVFLAIFAYKTTEGSKELSLQQLRTDNEYLFYGIEWGSSVELVERRVGEIELIASNATQDRNLYNSKREFLLNDQKSAVTFNFLQGKLQVVQLSYEMESAEFYSLIEKVRIHYGEESRTTENKKEIEGTSDSYTSKVYIWETEHSMLQISTIIDTRYAQSAVIISLGENVF